MENVFYKELLVPNACFKHFTGQMAQIHVAKLTGRLFVVEDEKFPNALLEHDCANV